MFAHRVVTLSFAKSVFCRTNKSAPPPEESVQSSMHDYCQTSQNMIFIFFMLGILDYAYLIFLLASLKVILG